MNKKKGKTPQVKVGCIFCGQTPLTKEHYWPKWIKPLIDQQDTSDFMPNKHMMRVTDIQDFGMPYQNKQVSHKLITGPPESWQPKIVCSVCNNGWMSQLEDKVKPILTPLILGEPYVISRSDRRLISQWFYLKTIIGEHLSTSHKLITAQKRRDFKKTGRVSNDWDMWIGKADSPNWSRYHSQPVGGFTLKDYLRPRNDEYLQESSLMMIGHLILYGATFPVHAEGLPAGLKFSIVGGYGQKFSRIHPYQFSLLNFTRTRNWKNFIPITKEEVELLIVNNQTFTSNLMAAIHRNSQSFRNNTN